MPFATKKPAGRSIMTFRPLNLVSVVKDTSISTCPPADAYLGEAMKTLMTAAEVVTLLTGLGFADPVLPEGVPPVSCRPEPSGGLPDIVVETPRWVVDVASRVVDVG